MFCAKNRSKKLQIFEKWEHFENGPPCKGYSPCKILTLAQNLKFQKTCQNPFYKSFTVVLCKKPLQNTPNIREMRAFWKSVIMQNPHFGSKIKIPKNMSKSILQIIYSCSVQKTAPKNTKYSRKSEHFENRPSCKGYSPCKIFNLAQKLKFQKTCQNPFYKSFTVVLCKKPLQKTPNIRKWEHFQNRPSCKGYSPCKILNLAQKLKFQKTCQNPFYKSCTVALCKKPLQKTPNIQEIRAFWKSAIMQRL